MTGSIVFVILSPSRSEAGAAQGRDAPVAKAARLGHESDERDGPAARAAAADAGLRHHGRHAQPGGPHAQRPIDREPVVGAVRRRDQRQARSSRSRCSHSFLFNAQQLN